MTGSANMEADQRATATLAHISAQLKALENVARVRGSPTCDHLAGRLAEVRRDLQRVIGHQPPAAVSEVTRQLIERDRKGREKYGVTLDRRDLSVSEWLQHMAEELMDAAGYALAAKRESEQTAAVDIGQFRTAVATHQLACRKTVRDCREGKLPPGNIQIYLGELAEANRLLDLVDSAYQQGGES